MRHSGGEEKLDHVSSLEDRGSITEKVSMSIHTLILTRIKTNFNYFLSQGDVIIVAVWATSEVGVLLQEEVRLAVAPH